LFGLINYTFLIFSKISIADKRNIPEIFELDKSAFGGPSIVNVFPLPV